MKLSYDVINALQGRTLVTAESCTGGGIGATLTAVPGCSKVYKGGIISYTNAVKTELLNVDPRLLNDVGPVSALVAEAMALGARKALSADVAVSVTGLAGPDGDELGNSVGTVYIGYADETHLLSEKFMFDGDREKVRQSAIEAALRVVLLRNQ